MACEFGLLQDNHEVRPISFDNARQSSSICFSVVREINKINERELELGVGSASWHDEYKGGSLNSHRHHLQRTYDATSDSAYIFIGGLHYDLTEGDVITIFSQ